MRRGVLLILLALCTLPGGATQDLGELRQLLERALEKHLPRKHQRGARGQGGIKVQGEGVRADVGGGAGGEGGGVTRGAGVGGEEVEGRLGEGTTSEGGKERAKPAVGTPQHGDSLLLRRLQAGRVGRQVQSADPGALMYLPLGGAGNIRCPTAADAAAVNIAQMTFLATSMNILSIVANINNNLNNNNNNNNQLNINAQSNNNVVTNTNVNNGNQVNVMVPILMP